MELVIEDEELIEVEMKIGDFVEYNEVHDIDVPIDLLNNYYVNTPSGLTRINTATKKDIHRVIEIEFDDGTIQRVAEKHLYPQYDGTDIYAEDAEYVISDRGRLNIVSKEYYCDDYVYDIGISNPHLYYTADGILSHNSAFMASQAANMLLKGNKILYLTLEMSEEETAKRIDANILDIDINELRRTEIDVIKDKFNRVKDSIGELIIKEYAAGTFNTLHLEGLLQELSVDGFVPDAIFIDYIGLMASSRISLSTAGGSYGYIKSIAEELHGFSKKHDTRIITASQLNRCLTKDTIIENIDGERMKLQDVEIGDTIKGYNKNVTVKQKVITEKQKVYKVTLKSGKVIKVSGKHRFPSKYGLISVENGMKEGVYINSGNIKGDDV